MTGQSEFASMKTIGETQLPELAVSNHGGKGGP